MEDIFSRTRGLIGDEYAKLATKRVLVVGLGGVGGTVFASLVRSGVSHFHIVDFDKVEASNLNRQVLYTYSDIGKEKVEVAKDYALSINPEADIKITSSKVSSENIESILDGGYDYICDAVDDINAKVAIAKYALNHKIPLITATGAANKLDPSQIKIASLDKSEGDPLAKKLRTSLRSEGIDIKQICCAFSSEKNENISNSSLNSVIFVTSSMGLTIGSYIFNSLLK
ncbi:MAG: ThiF family adenylyltransferase [Coprobacillus sp.]|nr:ThiF family adenylyltransferase [Coprobacillus sp.]